MTVTLTSNAFHKSYSYLMFECLPRILYNSIVHTL